MVFEHDSTVSEYQHEKHRPREAEALHTLRKVASLVKPIMRQRGWRVGVLTEFYPPETNLLGLNWNKGQKICLRLRYPGDANQFLPLEQVVDTMLHELCHIVHGPHDQHFHKLWDQLREEHESLLRKGYTGEGFHSTGHKLGGRRIPMHEARRQARAAAEKRAALTAGSGQKLGGRPVRRGEDIRKVIADAAERRTRVTKGCSGSGMSADRERELVQETNKSGFRTKADEDDANEEAIMLAYIDLIQEEEKQKWGEAYLPPSKENPLGSQGSPIEIEDQPSTSYSPDSRQRSSGPKPPIPTSTKPPLPRPASLPSSPSSKPSTEPSISSRTSNPAPQPTPPHTSTWTCEICTLVNPSTYLCCDACTTERPFPPSSSPTNPHQPTTTNPPKPPPPTTTPSTRALPTSIRDSNAKKAVRSLLSLEATTSTQKPDGWVCHACGTYMENQWWTCAGCGVMKLSS